MTHHARTATALVVVATGFAGGFLAAPEEPPATTATHTRSLSVERVPAIPAFRAGALPDLATAPRKPKHAAKPQPRPAANDERRAAVPSVAPPPIAEPGPATPAAPHPAAPEPATPRPPAPETPPPAQPAPPAAPAPTPAPPTDPGDSYDTSGDGY